MALDILEEGIVGIWDFLLKVAIVTMPILSLQLPHPTKAAWLDLGQRLQRPSRPTLRHSEVINNVQLAVIPFHKGTFNRMLLGFIFQDHTSSD